MKGHVISRRCVRHFALIGGKRKGFATKTHAYRAIAKKMINIEIAQAVDADPAMRSYDYLDNESYQRDRKKCAMRVMAARWPSPFTDEILSWVKRSDEINALAEKLRSEDESVL